MKKEPSLPILTVHCLARFELFFQENENATPRLLPKPATAKAQSLLAFLLTDRDQSHARDRLVSMFWGDRPDQRARRSLATALWQIRRCFPDKSFIQADVYTVQFIFPGRLQVDAEAFVTAVSHPDINSLQTAVSLYQGDFLDSFYDEWIINKRYRLQSQFLETLSMLMRLYETTGAYKAALETAVRLLANDPLREEAHRVVMRTYCYLGQRNAALKQYADCRQIIAEELGVEPTPETQQLYHDICDNRPAALLSIATPPAYFPLARPQTHASSGHHPLAATAVPPLVGRDKELMRLAALWQQTLAAESGLLIIRGEAGVGKTRLAESFAGQLQRQGYRVLWGRCYEFERVLPYQPIAEAVRSLLLHLPPQDLSAIPNWSLAEVARIVPALLELQPALNLPIMSELGGEQTSLFTALARFLTGLASVVPCLMVIEDLQWAGESTLQLLHFLARQLHSRPVLILATARPVSADGRPLRPFQDSLMQEGLATVLNLSRLAAGEVKTLVAEMSGRGEEIAPLAQRLFRETEGNPFFLVEICKTLFENKMLGMESGIWQGDFERIRADVLPLPAGITNAVRARIRRLPPKTQKLLGVTAVLGREFDFDLLNAVWGKGEEATLEELDNLLRVRLIREGSGDLGRDFAFTHHKIQEVAYADLPHRWRQHVHAQAGHALQTLYTGQENAVAAELAHHFEQAQRLNKQLRQQAIHFLQLAGKQAAGQFANADAQKYFSRALDLTPETNFDQRYELLMARQEVYGIQGKRENQTQDLFSLKEMVRLLTTAQQATILVHEARFDIE
ncbi:MAG: AAA family ATPase, partial [Anaerolineae bacterium]